ncbi:hypothetical protein B1F79_00985 [Coxiella-like endosymbiont of Rhipicephalus sanguineus]|uniref:hypothetical protein n=1 Tax=Coxiella-like endosymbiont of Rhipicephalus sanguineus TaxID=1955402 RepID=UPI00203BF938|nr:hypothetical protein [Coxiella-like endosymbiont of Rhipicephalus sanguineus]MBT8506310.1 hypothetical protein [Coxiella-like endosymbiont of Rhipicephalus sanguineus]
MSDNYDVTLRDLSLEVAGPSAVTDCLVAKFLDGSIERNAHEDLIYFKVLKQYAIPALGFLGPGRDLSRLFNDTDEKKIDCWERII